MSYRAPENSPVFEQDGKQYCKRTGKRVYHSVKEAVTSQNKMRKHYYEGHTKSKKHHTNKKGTTERWYKCEYCGWYHTTSMSLKEYKGRL